MKTERFSAERHVAGSEGKRMQKKNVLIAGASRGLGRNFVRKYLEDGWQVFAGVRRTDSLADLKEEYPDSLYAVAMDVSDTASVQEAAEQVKRVTDRIDLLINNAGIHSATSYEVLEKADLDECREVYDVNALGPLRVVKAFLSLIPTDGTGMIVNISSDSGSIGTAGRIKEFDYCMSKAALNMATKLLDNYLADRSIRLLAVQPGWMRTDMGGQNADLDPYDAAAQLVRLFGEMDRTDREPLFVGNDGTQIPW